MYNMTCIASIRFSNSPSKKNNVHLFLYFDVLLLISCSGRTEKCSDDSDTDTEASASDAPPLKTGDSPVLEKLKHIEKKKKKKKQHKAEQ